MPDNPTTARLIRLLDAATDGLGEDSVGDGQVFNVTSGRLLDADARATAGDQLTETLVWAGRVNAGLAAAAVADPDALGNDTVLKKLAELIKRLTERVGALAAAVGADAFSITTGWPAVVQVSVTFPARVAPPA
jgi:hypothetical protein